MLYSLSRTFPLRVALLALASAFIGATLWSGQIAWASEANLVGRVSAMPAGTLIGTWVVQGVSFATTNSTDFRQDKGAFAVGGCVEVEYVGAVQPFAATKIASKNSDDCSLSGTPTGSPTTTPDGTSTPVTPGATPSPSAEQEAYGQVESKPTSGLVGAWVIGGVTYNAPAGAEFKQRSGPLVVGACAKVHYAPNTTPFTVRELESRSAADCGGSVPTPGATPSATPVSGTQGELYGVLQSFPSSLIGSWNIGGMTFVATANTEFKQERGAFALGVTVKVHFAVDSSGANIAREIETKFANDDNGSDDDGNGSFEGAEGHAYGLIDSFPANLTGAWRIGGIDYTATANTTFAQNDGAFTVGKQVKVEYHLDADGSRIARKIETTSDSGGATAPTRFKLFGFVKQMPASGFVGQWVVDNIAFVATTGSQFKANNGLLGLGAYVAVEYLIQDGRNQVHEIETHIPPGAGPQTAIGRIDDKGGALMAAAVQATTWTIAGVNYTITPATDLNDLQSALDVGKTALVNSYTAPDGSLVATQVRGITLVASVYMPLVRR